MGSAVVRVPERVQQEVQAAARVTGRSSGEIIEAAWQSFKISPEFEVELKTVREALASGDIETVTDLMIRRSARERADRIRSASE